MWNVALVFFSKKGTKVMTDRGCDFCHYCLIWHLKTIFVKLHTEGVCSSQRMVSTMFATPGSFPWKHKPRTDTCSVLWGRGWGRGPGADTLWMGLCNTMSLESETWWQLPNINICSNMLNICFFISFTLGRIISYYTIHTSCPISPISFV